MRFSLVFILIVATACGRLENVGQAPAFSGGMGSGAAYSSHAPQNLGYNGPTDASSLWSGSQESLLGDRRAARRGDILTVVVEIDDSAQISNSSGRNRSGAQNMGMGSLFGIPQRLEGLMPDGASWDNAVDTSSSSTFKGTGNVTRNEKLTLRIAATVIREMPNGVLQIEGRQEVRVNFELRELIVTGYVRPDDISRQNEITYDKIASAQISYGGRGQISEVQQPRYGQQAAEILLPF